MTLIESPPPLALPVPELAEGVRLDLPDFHLTGLNSQLLLSWNGVHQPLRLPRAASSTYEVRCPGEPDRQGYAFTLQHAQGTQVRAVVFTGQHQGVYLPAKDAALLQLDANQWQPA